MGRIHKRGNVPQACGAPGKEQVSTPVRPPESQGYLDASAGARHVRGPACLGHSSLSSPGPASLNVASAGDGGRDGTFRAQGRAGEAPPPGSGARLRVQRRRGPLHDALRPLTSHDPPALTISHAASSEMCPQRSARGLISLQVARLATVWLHGRRMPQQR